MRKPIRITAPRPTLEELEKHFRISKKRVKELQAIVAAYKEQLARQSEGQVDSSVAEKSSKSASAA